MDEFKCGICLAAFNDFIKFMEHKIQHAEPENKIDCLLCCGRKQFDDKSSLLHHLTEKHLVNLTRSNETSDSCMKICNTNTADSLHEELPEPVLAHSVTGKGVKSYFQDNSLSKCDLMSNSSNTDNKSDLKQHKLEFHLCQKKQEKNLPLKEKINFKKEVDPRFHVLKNRHIISEDIDHKEESQSLFYGSNVVTNNLSNENIFEENVSDVSEEQFDKNLAAHPVSDVVQTLVTNIISSPLSVENLSKNSLTCNESTNQNDIGQEQGTTTRILLPLPLDLSSTQNLCQALNLSLQTSQNHLSNVNNLLHSSVTFNNKPVRKTLTENKLPKTSAKEKGIKATSPQSQMSSENFKQVFQGASSLISSKFCDVSKVDSSVSPSITSEEDGQLSQDFYFLLGNMNIKGSSLNYQRTEFRCIHCSFTTAWRPSLVKHMKHFHKDTLEIHSILEIRNIAPSKDNSVTSIQEGKKDFKVMKMSQYLAGNQKVKSPKKRIRKLERQDIPGKYHCPQCHKVFGRLRYMRRHQSTHRTERAHLCDDCGKSFKTKAILVAHRRSHKSKNYYCPQCDFVSSSSAAIHIHRQLHPNGSVICDICGNAYIDKSTLNKHMKVHDFSRPFPCTHPGCTWRFKTDVMRKAHVRSHTTIGKFSCSQCGYIFRQKHHLQRHIVKIHQGQQIKSVALASPELLSLSPPLNASSFTTQNLSAGQEILLDSSGHHDLIKTPMVVQDPLTPPCGIMAQSEMFSPTTNHILCSITDTSFGSNYVDPEHTMIEVLVGNKQDDGTELELEDDKILHSDIDANNLGNLEYITDTGEVVQLMHAGHTYVARDQYGNLVHYKLPEDSSQQIYLIGVNNPTEIGDSTEQTITINPGL
ncbi:hypothetical protein Btru_031104 [Bulinus truncatus]|nr:hypothetical protein Btru_031104 [Bulinus truncatus]